MERRTVDTGISGTYVANWTVPMGIREFLQNWLDIRQTFPGGRQGHKADCFTCNDVGPGLAMRHFALGISEKESPNAIGQFGEGFKLALLVLARAQRAVMIETVGYSVIPVMQESETYHTETLHLGFTPNTRKVGTRVTIQCAPDEYATAKGYFLALNAPVWADRKGGILENPKALYVQGSKITQWKEMLYGYNLRGITGQSIMNRDRTAVDLDAARQMLRDIIVEGNPKVIAGFLQADDCFEHTCTVSWAGWTAKTRRAWKAVWTSLYGRRSCYSCGDTDTDAQAQYRHYKVIDVPWAVRDVLHVVGILNSEQILDKIAHQKTPARIPMQSLSTTEKASLAYAKRMVRLHYTKRVPKITIVAQLDEHMGEYDSGKRTIRLEKDALATPELALHIVLHEIVHCVGGERDLTASFENDLLSVAVKMILKRNPPRKES